MRYHRRRKRIYGARIYFSWLGRHEFGVLVAGILLTAGTWAFLTVANQVVDGETHALDKKIVRSLRNPDNRSEPIGPRWLHHAVRDISALAGLGTLGLLTLGIVGYLLLQGKGRQAAFIVFALAGALLISFLLKDYFERPRPDYSLSMERLSSYSFPSAHSTMGASVYLLLGAVLAKIHTRWMIKAYCLFAGMGVAFLIGASRVYLAHHWPSDVVAGWTVGGMWALICWLMVQYLQRRGKF